LRINQVRIDVEAQSEDITELPTHKEFITIVPANISMQPLCFGPKAALICPKQLEKGYSTQLQHINQPEEPWTLDDSFLKTQRIPE
jgi:hypothetical protein